MKNILLALLAIIAIIMIILGISASATPPLISGIGFFVIAIYLYKYH